MVKFQLSGLYSSEEMGVGMTETSDIVIDIEACQNNTHENKKKVDFSQNFSQSNATTFSEDERQVLLSLGLEVKNEDDYYWIVGNTYGLNEKIKQLGYRFHSEKKNMVEANWKCSLRTHMKIYYNLGVSMQGYDIKKEITLNESFKALLESIFSDTDQAKKLIQAFEEFANDRATTQRLNFGNLKQEAIEQIRNELVSKDLFQSEIKRLEAEIKLSVSLLKQQGIYWLIGACVVSIATIISSVWAIMNFMVEHLK